MSPTTAGLQLISILVPDYDEAIDFYVNTLGFDLVSDTPEVSAQGKKKRWIVVRPPGNPQGCGILLARAEGPEQLAALGNQFGGRVGLFWRVDDFDTTYDKLQQADVEFCETPRSEPYGKVVVLKDLLGNEWDLLGPASSSSGDATAKMTSA